MRAVDMKKVTFGYLPNVDVLKEVEFYAEYGEVTLLSGMSGDGKSTLLSIISGIIPNSIGGYMSGQTFVAGMNIDGMKMSFLSRTVGCVLQNAELQIIQQIVEDEVAFGCENLAMPPEMIKRRVKGACAMMKIDPYAKTHTLSGGQKQRLITAATLAMGQKIVILDEPLANLDKEGTHILMSGLKKLAEKGYAVIVSEHRLDMVSPYVDSVWHISAGVVSKVEDKEAYISSQVGIIPDTATTKPSDEIMFKASGVTKSFKKKEVLCGIDMEIHRGERAVILGQNGCGKTTFTRILARLLRADKGDVKQYVNQKFGTRRASRKWFRSVGVVYQNPNYQLFMPSVREEVEYAAPDKEYAEKMMQVFGISHLVERHPQSLSEGQKRRVSIAAVCASKPQVLILDEPTVGQDYQGLNELVQMLNAIRDEQGTTIITVTHDIRCAASLTDKAFVIKDGIAIASGGKEVVADYFNGAFD